MRIERAGGQFQQVLTGCMAVLADKEQVAILVDRQDDDGSDVGNDIQPALLPVRKAQVVTPARKRHVRDK